MERNTKRQAAGEARREWRKAWGLIRCDGDPKTPMEDIALDAWHARRDGTPGQPWPGVRGRMLASGWRPLPPLPLP